MKWQSRSESEKTTYVLPVECRLDRKLCPEVIDFLEEKIAFLSSVQRVTWHLINKKVFSDKQKLNQYLQKRFHIKSRTANSIISDMQSRHDALMELKKRELKELDLRIAKKQEQIKNDKSFIDQTAPLAAQNKLRGDELKQYRFTKKGLYQRQLKLDRMKNQRKTLVKEIETEVLSLCFGGKALFKKQYSLKEAGFASHKQWQNAFRKSRDKNVYYLARAEETFGNQMCHLSFSSVSDCFYLTVLDCDKDSRLGAQGAVRFSYGLGELQKQLKWHEEHSPLRRPVTARFVRRKKGWYLILSLNVDKTPVYTAERSKGVVSMDFNYSFIELAELNEHGNMINKIRLDIPHAGRSAQGIHETRAAIKTAVQYAARVQKPLAAEDLDFTTKKAKLTKKQKKGYNRMLCSLNFGQYKEALIRRCGKDGVELIVVNPAYTSATAKKYTEARHLTIHEAAAWQIGRRAMGFRLKAKKSAKQIAFEKNARKDLRAKAKRKAQEAKKKAKNEAKQAAA